MSFAPELNDFRFRLTEYIGGHEVEIICEQSDRLLSTKIDIAYRDEEYEQRTHTILIDFVPLHEITDLMATMTAQVEKARAHLETIRPELQEYRPNLDALKDVVSWTRRNIVNFYSLNVLMNVRQLLKKDIQIYRLPRNCNRYADSIAPDQTVIELPDFHASMSIFITIETDRPFGEIKLREDFNYKITKMRVTDKTIDSVEVSCDISEDILEQINKEMDDNWMFKDVLRRNMFFFQAAPSTYIDTSDLPF